ncbi:hypothetical protein RF11_06136 [Thelohanellus kitauei]|uniref:Uncharacterized protein n=1 Tax=Thelohanellus kitauei TaxID=669202 RepID=A0A0C2IHV0_THEKT|nr:hypothetical protein RF11_06136 [Thelohanellus kitauei]
MRPTKKLISLILFIILEILSFVSCGLMIAICVLPCLFTMVNEAGGGQGPSDFGAFSWYFKGEKHRYENMKAGFRFLQFMLVTSTIAVTLCPILAILGYVFKKVRLVAGFSIIGAAIFFGIFTFAYFYCSIDYVVDKGNSFIFKTAPTGITFKGKMLRFSLLPFLFYGIDIVLFLLGSMVLIHKFYEPRPIIVRQVSEEDSESDGVPE